MSSGVQANLYLSATTWTNIAAGPSASGRLQTLTVTVCNQASTTGQIYLGIATTGSSSASASQYLEYLTPINGNGGVYERTGIVLGYNQILLIYSVQGSMSVLCYGVEGTGTTSGGAQNYYLMSASTYYSMATTPSSGRIKALTVNFCNQSSSTASQVRLAISTSSSSPSNTDFIEYNYSLPAYGTLERTGIVISSGYYVFAWANTATVSAYCWGVEDSA